LALLTRGYDLIIPPQIADGIDKLNNFVGRTVAWFTLLMVLVTFLVVVLRYWFSTGWIWLQESVTWMHAAVFMLAAAYTLMREDHVRVDIFYRGMSVRSRALVDAIGTCVFLFPVAGFLIWSSWDYVGTSWMINESSQEPGGLPFPFPSLMKAFIPVASALLLLQGTALLLRSLATLFGNRND